MCILIYFYPWLKLSSFSLIWCSLTEVNVKGKLALLKLATLGISFQAAVFIAKVKKQREIGTGTFENEQLVKKKM